MKILIISAQNEECKGGLATWTYHYLNWLKNHDIKYDLINTDVIGNRKENLTSRRNIIEEYIRLRKIINQAKYYLNLNNKYDIVHFNTNIGNYGIFRDIYLAKLIQKKGMPIICEFHCDIPYWINNILIKKMTRSFTDKCHKALVLCENSKKYLENNCKVQTVKIPNFIQDEYVASQKSINKRIEKIFFTGRISNAKGCKEIYELAILFPEKQFYLAGEISEDFQKLIKPSNVVLLGLLNHDKLFEYLDSSDLFLFPSHTEGFSLSLLESMARGVPSIATKVGANEDMLEGKGGILVDIADVKAMKNAIELLENEEERKMISEWLLNKVRNEYTVDAVMKKMIKIYESVLN